MSDGKKTAAILERLKEPSTWRGIVVLAGVLGVAIKPEVADQAATAVAAAVGLIEIFRRE